MGYQILFSVGEKPVRFGGEEGKERSGERSNEVLGVAEKSGRIWDTAVGGR